MTDPILFEIETNDMILTYAYYSAGVMRVYVDREEHDTIVSREAIV